MSMFKTPLTKIVEVTSHPNAHSLDIVKVYGFSIVVRRNEFSVGDAVIYIPVDSILPSYLEQKLFPEGSKITLSKSRVRQIKIRSVYSQGMVFSPATVGIYSNSFEEDFAEILGISKYEPPTPEFQSALGTDGKKKRNKNNPLFDKYNGLDNIKWMPAFFSPEEEVVVEEKLHGTLGRAGYLPVKPRSWWHKLLIKFGWEDKYEFVYGSNNVDIYCQKSWKGYYGEDIYGKCFKRMNMEEKLAPGEIVYGEIIGPGIQKNYDYGMKEHMFVAFDVKKDGVFLDPLDAAEWADLNSVAFVPILSIDDYANLSLEEIVGGPSVFHPGTKVREGVVIKSSKNYGGKDGSKRALKMINPDYLAKDQTDFH